MKRKFLSSIILGLLLIISISSNAYAETVSELQTGDRIFFGEYNGNPISWIVLDSDTMNDGNEGIFLCAEYVVQERSVQYSYAIAEWKDSLAQQSCVAFYDQAFSKAEQACIPAVDVHEERSELFGLFWRPADLEGEKVFYLSAPEVYRYIGEDDGAPGISATTPDGTAVYYWLRSPHGYHTDYSGLVLDGNKIHDGLVYLSWGGRPAMNIDRSCLCCLTLATENEDGKYWKATVTDDTLRLEISNISREDNELQISVSAIEDEDIDLALLTQNENGIIDQIECLKKNIQSSDKVILNLDDYPNISDSISLALYKQSEEKYTDYLGEPIEVAVPKPESQTIVATQEVLTENETEGKNADNSREISSLGRLGIAAGVLTVGILITTIAFVRKRGSRKMLCLLGLLPVLAYLGIVFRFFHTADKTVQEYPQAPTLTEEVAEEIEESPIFVEPTLSVGEPVFINGITPSKGSFEKDAVTYVRFSDIEDILELKETDIDSNDGKMVIWRNSEVLISPESASMTVDGKMVPLDGEVLLCDGGNDWLVPIESFSRALEIGLFYDEEESTLYCTPGAGEWTLPGGYDVPILMYHGTGYAPYGANLIVNPDSLEEQLKHLTENGYSTLWFEDLWNIEDYEKPVILTFDDGWANNYTYLLPLLQKYNCKATIFVITGSTDRHSNNLTSDQLLEMQNSGLVSLQSHTVSHGYLDQMTEEEQIFEITQSKLDLARLSGKEPFVLCYPSGQSTETTQKLTLEHYRFGVKMFSPYAYNTSDDPSLVFRFYIGQETTMDEYSHMLERVFRDSEE